MEQRDQRMETANEEAGRHGTPGWLRAIVVVGIFAAAIIVTAILVIGADHGPGRHQPDEPAQTPTNDTSPIDHG